MYVHFIFHCSSEKWKQVENKFSQFILIWWRVERILNLFSPKHPSHCALFYISKYIFAFIYSIYHIWWKIFPFIKWIVFVGISKRFRVYFFAIQVLAELQKKKFVPLKRDQNRLFHYKWYIIQFWGGNIFYVIWLFVLAFHCHCFRWKLICGLRFLSIMKLEMN